MNFLIEALLNIRYFVGFIKNGAFPPKLTEAEEDELTSKLFSQNESSYARNKLIEHNLRLVAHIAKKYNNTKESDEDLISIGTIGLIKAVDSYSLEKKVKLATYAAKCIDNEILMTLRSNKKYAKDIMLFDTIGQDKDGTEISLLDVIPSDIEEISLTLEKEENIKKLTSYLSVLDERELEIISLRYGLNGKSEHTQKEIAKLFAISRSYVSRIEKRATSKLLQEFKKSA